jgi:catechol-2,3-dioxygenase
MLGHIGVNVRDLVRAKAYYDIIMPMVGYAPYRNDKDQFAYRPAERQPGPAIFFYPALEEGDFSRHRPGLQHLAFVVDSRAAVHALHTTVQELGSPVIHAPQLFPQYRPHYYALFWQDPDGFMLEVLCLKEESA